jgi:hypothetical protein
MQQKVRRGRKHISGGNPLAKNNPSCEKGLIEMAELREVNLHYNFRYLSSH